RRHLPSDRVGEAQAQLFPRPPLSSRPDGSGEAARLGFPNPARLSDSATRPGSRRCASPVANRAAHLAPQRDERCVFHGADRRMGIRRARRGTVVSRSLTILISTHNRVELLERTLYYLGQARHPRNWQVEVLVVANACTDGTQPALESYANTNGSGPS